MTQAITTTETAIVIPFDVAIALYQLGYLDPALLGYCLPIAIAENHCPEVLKDGFELATIKSVLGEER